MTPHYKRYCGSRDFARNAVKLRIELKLGAPRRHLDVLVELLECNLRDAGDSQLAEQYAAELDQLKALVRGRSHLEVVK
jgi:hypothetical protein